MIMAAQQDPPVYQGFGFTLHRKDIEKAAQAVAAHPWTSVILTITVAVVVLAYKGLHRRDIENAVTWIIAHPRAGVFMLVLFTVIPITAIVLVLAYMGLYVILALIGMVLLAIFVSSMLGWRTLKMLLPILLCNIAVMALLGHNFKTSEFSLLHSHYTVITCSCGIIAFSRPVL